MYGICGGYTTFSSFSLQTLNLQTQQALSNAKDTDMASVLSALVAQQTAFEATLRIAAQTMQMSLANYL